MDDKIIGSPLKDGIEIIQRTHNPENHNYYGLFFIKRPRKNVAPSLGLNQLFDYLWPDGTWRMHTWNSKDDNAYYETEEEAFEVLERYSK